MKSKKFTQNLSLSSSLDESLVNPSLSKLIGHSNSKSQSNPIRKFVIHDEINLEDTLKLFEEPFNLEEVSMDEMIVSFANKYRSPTYTSLDELLAASSNQSTYSPTTVKKLSDILDGLIDDL